ncbi:MAG TPA: 6-phosphofructokinase, partial [Gemmataceae bacterium]|nr:6-phosphofructokinase [Gemmataceae bacterium]
ILIPEVPADVEHMCTVLKRRREKGKLHAIVVVSEGAQLPEGGVVATEHATDDFGHVKLGGIGEVIADLLEKRLKIETRHVTLGHLQRGGSPSAYDRVLATRFGIKAGELVLEGKFGHMAALKGNDIAAVPLGQAVSATKRLDMRYFQEAREFFP